MGVAEVDIERLLIWTYQNQVADQVTRRVMRGLAPQGYASTMGAVVRQGLLGCRIDGGLGVVTCADDLHPDAEAVHDAVLSLPSLACGLVIMHAKAGTRPDWMEGVVQRLRPVRMPSGKPLVEYWDRERRKPAYCHIELYPSDESIRFARGVYLEWWDALDHLSFVVEGRLTERRAVGPECPREPWV